MKSHFRVSAKHRNSRIMWNFLEHFCYIKSIVKKPTYHREKLDVDWHMTKNSLNYKKKNELSLSLSLSGAQSLEFWSKLNLVEKSSITLNIILL